MPISLDVGCPGEEKGMKAERATEKKLKIKRERYTRLRSAVVFGIT